MEKQLSAAGYWLGLTCTALALIFRMLTAIHVSPPHLGASSGVAIDSMSFFHAATMFFLLTIASWCRSSKS